MRRNRRRRQTARQVVTVCSQVRIAPCAPAFIKPIRERADAMPYVLHRARLDQDFTRRLALECYRFCRHVSPRITSYTGHYTKLFYNEKRLQSSPKMARPAPPPAPRSAGHKTSLSHLTGCKTTRKNAKADLISRPSCNRVNVRSGRSPALPYPHIDATSLHPDDPQVKPQITALHGV